MGREGERERERERDKTYYKYTYVPYITTYVISRIAQYPIVL